MKALAIFTASILLATGSAAPSPAADKSGADKSVSGHATAQTVCARCHEVGAAASPDGKTDGKAGGKIGDGTPPAFALIAQDPKMTPEKLRRYIRFPHGAMDNVFITQREADALVAYIQSLKPAPKER